MNLVEFKKLSSQLASLRDSTELTVYSHGLSAILTRRCSQYLSHRGIVFQQCPAASGPLHFENTNYSVGVIPADWSETDGACDSAEKMALAHAEKSNYEFRIISAVVPFGMLKDLFEQAWRIFPVPYAFQGNNSGLARVIFTIPVVDHWDEAGKPVFKLKAPKPSGLTEVGEKFIQACIAANACSGALETARQALIGVEEGDGPPAFLIEKRVWIQDHIAPEMVPPSWRGRLFDETD